MSCRSPTVCRTYCRRSFRSGASPQTKRPRRHTFSFRHSRDNLHSTTNATRVHHFTTTAVITHTFERIQPYPGKRTNLRTPPLRTAVQSLRIPVPRGLRGLNASMEQRRPPEYILEVFADPACVRDVVKGTCASDTTLSCYVVVAAVEETGCAVQAFGPPR